MNDADKQELQSWVQGAFSIENVLAVGGRFSDGGAFLCFAHESFEACNDDAVWSTLATAIDQTASGSWGTSSVWTFEYAMLWVARRSDGVWLGIFTNRDLGEASRHALRARLETFVS